MGNRKIKRIAAALTCILCAAMTISTTVRAEEPLDTSREVTLKVSYTHEGTPIPGAEFKLYKAADTDANTNLTRTGDFSKYPVKLTNLSDDEWQKLALTLSGYVMRDQTSPVQTGVTDAKGEIVFNSSSSSKLTPGLYLLIGKSITIDRVIYKAKPTMVFIPGSDDGKNTWKYDVTVQPKYELGEEERFITCKVLKIWDDSGYENERPEEITVDLLKDGKVYDSVKLTEKNSWRYTWENLSDKNEWTVVEKEIERYTVKVTKEGVTYTITNTHEAEKPPEKPPVKPPKVPQTGLLWWPIPILAVCGILMISIGMLRRKKKPIGR